MLLVPHRRSGGGALQTASVGWRGEEGRGLGTLKGRGKGAICWDKGGTPRVPVDTHGSNPPQLVSETLTEEGM